MEDWYQGVVIWPASTEGFAQRTAYMAAATANHPEAPDPYHASWIATALDANGQPWCPRCRAPEWEEPAACIAVRDLGVLHKNVLPPPVEEEETEE